MIVISQSTYKKIFAVIAISAFVEPAYFAQAPVLFADIIYDLLKITCSIFILFNFICRQRMSKAFIFASVFESALLLSTFFIGGNIVSFLKNSAYVIVMAMLLDWMLVEDGPVIISAVSLVFGVYTYISVLTFILFPNGLYTHPTIGWKNCWFLGYKNIATPVLVTGVVCAVYDSFMRKRKVDLYALSVAVCSGGYMIAVGSATGMVAMLITLVMVFLFFRFDGINKILICKNIIIGNFVLFVLLVFIRIQNILDLFGNLIVQMGKTMTFSSRTNLWDRVIPLVQTSLFWGHGVQSSEEYINVFHYAWAAHLHSYYLQVLFEGGIVALALLFCLLLVGGTCFDACSKYKESTIIKYGLMAYLLAIQMEAYGQISTMFVFIFILYYIEKIEKQYEPLRLEYEAAKTKKIKFMWGKSLCTRRKID